MIKREKTRGGSDESKERKIRVGREGKGREGVRGKNRYRERKARKNGSSERNVRWKR